MRPRLYAKNDECPAAIAGHSLSIDSPLGLMNIGVCSCRCLERSEKLVATRRVADYSRLIRRRRTYQNIVISELNSATDAATWLPMG